jgi:predicted ATPase
MEPNDKKIEVVFTKNSDFDSTILNKIVIYPKPTLKKTSFNIQHEFFFYYSDSTAPLKGDVFLSFLPSEEYAKGQEYLIDDHSGLLNILESFQSEYVTSNSLNNYFTLLPSIQSYRDVVTSLGSDLANDFLSSINDVVINKNKKNDWIDRALDSKAFKIAFLRNSQSFFAFHNADSVLGGIEYEDIEVISQSLKLQFKLAGFVNEHEINLKYSTQGLIPKRINILIGKNGVGKSQALSKFCRISLKMQNEKGFIKDTDQNVSRPMINRLIAIGTPGETGNTFPGERIGQQKMFYRRLHLTRNRSGKTSRRIGETLVQLSRSSESIKGILRWDFFWNAISNILPADDIYVRRKDKSFVELAAIATIDDSLNSREFESSLDPSSEPYHKVGKDYVPLSSGQLTFFKFALLCCLYIENGSFILMDEPETHLHPNMISDFIELLDSILEGTGSQALIATHSAYFVREVAREQVHVFKSDSDGVINIVQPRLRTFGSDVDSIAQFVFDEDIENRLTDKVFNKIKGKKFEDIEQQLSDELSMAALMDIKDRLEFTNEKD